MKYIDIPKLLNEKDKNGNTPEVVIITGNRTSGKTTGVCKFLLEEFIKNKSQFTLLYRRLCDIDNAAENHLGSALDIVCPDKIISSKKIGNTFSEIYLNDEKCGYCIPISKYNKIKLRSSEFRGVNNIFFDEFQSEDNDYLPDEINKFKSIHTSIARGNGKQSRFVRVIMASNVCSVINPYFKALGINRIIQSNTKRLRGHNWNLFVDFNQSAADAYLSSGFNRVFTSGNDYEINNKSKLDNFNKIKKLKGKNSYLFTFIDNQNYYGVRFYPVENLIYVSRSVDISSKNVYASSVLDSNLNVPILPSSGAIYSYISKYFKYGQIAFSDLESQEALINLLRMNM